MWSAARPIRFIPGDIASSTHGTVVCMGPGAVVDDSWKIIVIIIIIIIIITAIGLSPGGSGYLE